MGALFSAAWPKCIAVVLLLIAAGSFAAEPDVAAGWSVLHWSVEDGLPVNSINQITQDENGYIWLATMDGLARFDGQNFKVYDSGSHPGLASNRLTRIEHADDALWLLSEDNRLVRHAGGAFRQLGVDDGLPDAQVTVLERIDGVLWAGTTSGAAWWDGARFHPLDAARWPHYTQAILGDADGTVWLASRSGSLARWQAGRLEIAAEFGQPIWTLAPDPADGVWLGHPGGASLWRNGDVQPLDVSPEALGDVIRIEFGPDGSQYLQASVTLCRYRDGRLEILTDPLYRSGTEPMILDLPDTNEFLVNLGTELRMRGEPVFNGTARIDDLLVDRENNIWVATAGDGLYRLRTNALAHYLDHSVLGSNPAYPITVDTQQRIWVGTGGAGFFILDGAGRVLQEPGRKQPIQMIYSLLPPETPDGVAWIGGLGLHRWQGGNFSQLGIPRTLSQGMVYALYRDRRGRVWAGTHNNGLWRMARGRWQPVRMPGAISGARVRVMLEDRSGVLWMGTNGDGLLRWDGESFERIGSRQGLASPLVRALHLDGRGRLWIGTETHGLCRIGNPGAAVDALEVTCLSRSHGLFHHGIHQILDDGIGYLWLSSNRGIFRAEKSALDAAMDALASGQRGQLLRPATFLELDGLPNREANGGVQSAGIVGPGERLWFPTMAGPVVIDPARIGQFRIEPAAIMEGIRTGGRLLSPENSTIKLTPGPRDIGFDFTAPSFVSPRNLQFEYRLKGYEQDWRGPVTRRQVEYTNLPHGEYVFEVRARVGAGAPGTVAAQPLLVPPRFFERSSFYLLVAVLLLAMAVCAWRVRERHNRIERERLQAKVASRTAELDHEKGEALLARDEIARQAERLRGLDREKRAFFANISHELRTPLSLLLGPLDQYCDSPQQLAEQAPMMQRNARRLNRLVEQLLDLQRIEGGQLHVSAELYDLVTWAESLIELFEPLAEQRRIELRLERPEEGLLAWFDRDQMEKVLGNLLSNAIRYCGPEDRVRIELERDAETARIRVVDTGPGIPAQHLPNLFERFYRAVESDSPIEGTGIGLALSRDLIRLHGGDIEVESEPGAGTTFTLHWPARATAGQLHSGRHKNRMRHDRIADRNADPTEDESDVDRRRILLVDDNPDIRTWLSRSLAGEFLISTASDGVEALKHLKKALPDLVIADWMMPNMDGIELLSKLKKRPEYAGLPVIMLTARGDIDDRMGAYHAGAIAYVAKPFNIDILRAQIDSILEQQQRLRKRLAEQATADPTAAQTDIVESRFVRKTSEIIERNMHDPAFGIEQLAAALNMDRSALLRKTRDELSITPSELLRDRRLEMGYELLRQREGSVSEVAYAVGFGSVDGFSKAFRRKYQTSPSCMDTTPKESVRAGPN
mgnify:CR=1 FL=1